MALNENGKVGIGTNAPTNLLHVAGVSRAIAHSSTSDIRYKKDIVPIGDALGKTLQLRGVYYNWRTEEFPEHKFDTEKTIGVIAQEVEKIIPEVVHTDNTEEGFKTVSYDKLTPLLIEAIKEQQVIIEQQKVEQENLKTSLDVQTKKYETLEEKLEKQSKMLEDLYRRLDRISKEGDK
tara:strand:- start:313 stop:846 length:534 start_codon:yes stop_codon:yes gene_type:complete